MKQKLVKISVITLTAILTVYILYSTAETPNSKPNGFKRIMIHDVLTPVRMSAYKNILQNLCGVTESKLFFSGKNPEIIFTTNFQLKSIQTIQLDLPKLKDISPVFYTALKYPNVSVLAGNAKAVIFGNSQTKSYKIYPTHTDIFGNGVSIGNGSFVVQTVDSANLKATFKKFSIFTNQISEETNLSESIPDAGFNYDGILSYDSVTNRLFYSCYYCNKLTISDTNLFPILKTHSIDTFSNPSLKLAIHGSNVSYAKPPQAKNRYSTAYGGIIFILSLLKADNEPGTFFRQNAPIDMYNETDGSYLGTFYIPTLEDEKPNKLYFLKDNLLLVLYDSHQILFRLSEPNLFKILLLR